MIGWEWKRGDPWSEPALIRRGLDLIMVSGCPIVFFL